MERIVHISHNFTDAEKWDIQQQINASPDERQKAARELKLRYYGKNCPDVRKSREVVIIHGQ